MGADVQDGHAWPQKARDEVGFRIFEGSGHQLMIERTVERLPPHPKGQLYRLRTGGQQSAQAIAQAFELFAR